MKDPRDNKKTLGQPNYYRLAYHLAAHQVHAERARRHETSRGDDVNRFALEKPIPDARKVAGQLVGDADLMIEWFRARRTLREERWRRVYVGEPSRNDKRLLAFLDKTILPCAVVLLAAIDRQEDAVERVRELEKRSEQGTITYRADYNLACWHAEDRTAPGHGPDERALRYLRTALARAPRARAPELARWAKRDPTLRTLRDGPSAQDFREILALFAGSEPASETGEGERRQKGGEEK